MEDAHKTVSIVGVLTLRTSIVFMPPERALTTFRRRRPPLRATPPPSLSWAWAEAGW